MGKFDLNMEGDRHLSHEGEYTTEKYMRRRRPYQVGTEYGLDEIPRASPVPEGLELSYEHPLPP